MAIMFNVAGVWDNKWEINGLDGVARCLFYGFPLATIHEIL